MCPADCDAIPENPCSPKGEFIVDFEWEEKTHPHRILLAAESEWGTDRFGYNTQWRPVEGDFEKLLAVKAPFKLLIFSSDYTTIGTDGCLDGNFPVEFAQHRLKASLGGYGHHLAGETYDYLFS